MDLLKVV